MVVRAILIKRAALSGIVEPLNRGHCCPLFVHVGTHRACKAIQKKIIRSARMCYHYLLWAGARLVQSPIASFLGSCDDNKLSISKPVCEPGLRGYNLLYHS